ncbi:transglutaminase family protein [Nocardia gipuzkoensis]|uniref:transglutaminase-like domain-containing protein n=1 Tax=Nocardia gipuzkoensis TaxID=2749991 RepID=UPI001E430798|nr:transglutaminase family protein [Nocardia gipuzkoensis]UGT69392.1 transglutaminase family protein [Nocardia gipuzkoensis]
MDPHLRPTTFLDYNHPRLQQLIGERGWTDLPTPDRIAAVYTFVRDEIPFGYNASDDIPASAVLADGYGQCNTKTTLLMALLRALDVPTRFHGATIHKSLQRGILTGALYHIAPRDIIHSWAEVQHERRWVGLEGVILDRPYLDGIRAKFPDRRDRFLGYGVGTTNLTQPPIDWNGTDTAIQSTGVNNDYGTYHDPDTFYRQHGTNIRGLRAWLFNHHIRHIMNRNAAAVRSCTPSSPSAARLRTSPSSRAGK